MLFGRPHCSLVAHILSSFAWRAQLPLAMAWNAALLMNRHPSKAPSQIRLPAKLRTRTKWRRFASIAKQISGPVVIASVA